MFSGVDSSCLHHHHSAEVPFITHSLSSNPQVVTRAWQRSDVLDRVHLVCTWGIVVCVFVCVLEEESWVGNSIYVLTNWDSGKIFPYLDVLIWPLKHPLIRTYVQKWKPPELHRCTLTFWSLDLFCWNAKKRNREILANTILKYF